MVGTAFKTVLGTLENNDALYFDEAIDSLNASDKDPYNMLKQQTEIVKTTILNVNKTITNLESNK